MSATSTASRTINVRVPEALYQKLEAVASATARTKSFVTLNALTSYLDEQSWQIADIEAGIAEADRGEFASQAEVDAVFAKHAR
jgi:RHH-type transcriptional regulator, rel operon repressor / antitoxin RelB